MLEAPQKFDGVPVSHAGRKMCLLLQLQKRAAYSFHIHVSVHSKMQIQILSFRFFNIQDITNCLLAQLEM